MTEDAMDQPVTVRQGGSALRISAFVFALLGGIFALFGTVSGLGLAGLSEGLSPGSVGTDISGRLFLAFILAIITIIGGALILARRGGTWWGAALIVVSIVGSVAAGAFYLLGGLLGLVAGIIALFIRR